MAQVDDFLFCWGCCRISVPAGVLR